MLGQTRKRFDFVGLVNQRGVGPESTRRPDARALEGVCGGFPARTNREVREHGDHPASRGYLNCIGHDEQFHQQIVDGFVAGAATRRQAKDQLPKNGYGRLSFMAMRAGNRAHRARKDGTKPQAK